ncbi:MAG: glycoside hydrolase [Streptococcaceae bacterium]|jgi:hypothetical protein|nr:glycoside hydrolase [Streptococcaceae bacterium]
MNRKIIYSTLVISLVLIVIGAGLFIFLKPRAIDLQRKEITQNSIEMSKAAVSTPTKSTSDKYDYYQQPASDKLYVTSNHGKTWKTVPAALSLIRGGDYSAIPDYELMPGSYILKKDLMAFVYPDKNSLALFAFSKDAGKTWTKAPLDSDWKSLRFRQLDEMVDGTLIATLTEGRVMSQESGDIYQSSDGGSNWTKTGILPLTFLLQSASWTDKSHGFFGYKKDLKMTSDGGATLQDCQINLPAEYHTEYGDIFTTPEKVVKSGDNYLLTMNQGDTGDYKGGKVMAELISSDGGLTFNFLKEVAGDDQ